jgi:hypothetical protein
MAQKIPLAGTAVTLLVVFAGIACDARMVASVEREVIFSEQVRLSTRTEIAKL